MKTCLLPIWSFWWWSFPFVPIWTMDWTFKKGRYSGSWQKDKWGQHLIEEINRSNVFLRLLDDRHTSGLWGVWKPVTVTPWKQTQTGTTFTHNTSIMVQWFSTHNKTRLRFQFLPCGSAKCCGLSCVEAEAMLVQTEEVRPALTIWPNRWEWPLSRCLCVLNTLKPDLGSQKGKLEWESRLS